MNWLSNWWSRLRGASAEAPAPRKPKAADPVPPPEGREDGLTLADETPAERRSRVGAAGFDPYSSDAGFSKPHSWERVERD